MCIVTPVDCQNDRRLKYKDLSLMWMSLIVIICLKWDYFFSQLFLGLLAKTTRRNKLNWLNYKLCVQSIVRLIFYYILRLLGNVDSLITSFRMYLFDYDVDKMWSVLNGFEIVSRRALCTNMVSIQMTYFTKICFTLWYTQRHWQRNQTYALVNDRQWYELVVLLFGGV